MSYFKRFRQTITILRTICIFHWVLAEVILFSMQKYNFLNLYNAQKISSTLIKLKNNVFPIWVSIWEKGSFPFWFAVQFVNHPVRQGETDQAAQYNIAVNRGPAPGFVAQSSRMTRQGFRGQVLLTPLISSTLHAAENRGRKRELSKYSLLYSTNRLVKH